MDEELEEELEKEKYFLRVSLLPYHEDEDFLDDEYGVRDIVIDRISDESEDTPHLYLQDLISLTIIEQDKLHSFIAKNFSDDSEEDY